MQIKSEATLDEFRGPGVCAWCQKKVRGRQAHHLRCKGRGFRMDVRWNLAPLCFAFSGGCNCHDKIQGNKELNDQLWERVAIREGTSLDCAMRTLWWFDRLSKNSTHDQIERALTSADPDVAILARLTLIRAGKLPEVF